MSLIDQIKAAKHRATPGPWTWDIDDFPGVWCLAPGVLISDGYDGTPSGDEHDRADAALIALAPQMADIVLAAEELVEALDLLGEWQRYDACRIHTRVPLPEKLGCTDDAKANLMTALAAYHAATQSGQ